MPTPNVLLALIALTTATVSAQSINCPVILDGRVPKSMTTLELLDEDTGIYATDELVDESPAPILFPNVPNSRFDNSSYKSFEVILTDNSTSASASQDGTIRSSVRFSNDLDKGSPGYVGSKTLHFSLKREFDPNRTVRINDFEYQNVWHEEADASQGYQFRVEQGVSLEDPNLDPDTFKIYNHDNSLLFSTPIDDSDWQNFAITLDIEANTVQIYYSLGDGPLQPVTNITASDLTGQGQYHFGMLRKPKIGVVLQETEDTEGQIFGGVFVEDSTNGCISL